MKIQVKIQELSNDPVVEDSNEPFILKINPLATFREVKKKIQKHHGFHPTEQSLFHWMCPLDDTKTVGECLEESDAITVVIADLGTNQCATVSNASNDPIFLITGTREKFKIIPLGGNSNEGMPKRSIPKSYFARSIKFGVCSKRETGSAGKGIFSCYIYKAKDGADIEIEGTEKVYQKIGENREPLVARELKTFSESDIINGFLTKNMMDFLKIIGVGIDLAGTVVDVQDVFADVQDVVVDAFATPNN